MTLHHPTHAVVNLPAFRRNLSSVRSYIGSRPAIMAVVKAEAYGHGMLRIASEAIAAGAQFLAVARGFEGESLRNAGIDAPVLVFEAVPPGNEHEAINLNLDCTVVSLASARRLSDAAAREGKKVRVHVKVDTGMSRLGVAASGASGDIESIVRLPHLEVVGIYSHFATSEETDQSFARGQLAKFCTVLDQLAARKIQIPLRHMANSGAIMTLPESHFDMVRPGIMLYGYPPGLHMPQRFPLEPVLFLESYVAYVKTIPAHTAVSYGRKYTSDRDTIIATVPIGYADGYSRALRGKADVLIRGCRYPVVGTICMDQIMVDLGVESDVAEGDHVTLIGKDGAHSIDAWEIAEKTATIPYEVTCLVTSRVAREYRS